MTGSQTIGVIVPVHNGQRTIQRCLSALLRSHCHVDRMIVVDDASSDDSGKLARDMGVEVIQTSDRPLGPAHARNLAARQINTDILVFVDSDVEVDADAIGQLIEPLHTDHRIVATFGSYDDHPDCRRVAALYANLRHHCTHQASTSEAETFWAGLGAIRRNTFLAMGGFDESFTIPSIEDVELGVRLRQAGHQLRTIPSAQGKHLKDWTLKQLWLTDLFARAFPWSMLMMKADGPRGTLNAATDQKIAAMLAPLIVLTALLGIFFSNLWWLVTAACTAGWIVPNRSLFRLLFRRGGLRGLFGGMALHWIYYIYATFSLGSVWLYSRWQSADRLLRRST